MERCQDSGCGFENRQEYCYQKGGDPEGSAAYVIQAIDELLYDNNYVASENFGISVNTDGQILQRSFTITHFDAHTYILPPTKSTLAITHQTDRKLGSETYSIRLGWAVDQIDAITQPYCVQYNIDLYQSGLVQGQIEQPDFASNNRQTSPLTNYDLDNLYQILDLFAISQRAEKADNIRAHAA